MFQIKTQLSTFKIIPRIIKYNVGNYIDAIARH